MTALDVARYRETVGHFATGVVVVTAVNHERPFGFTCQTFGSLSIEPILISFAARSDGASWPKIREVEHIAINVLSEKQEAIARVFAASSPNKFDGIAWSTGVNGAPLIHDAIATLEGRLEEVVTFGDHDVAVVAVEFVSTHEGAPLIFYRGGFGSFAP